MPQDVSRRRAVQGIASVPYLLSISGRAAFAATMAAGDYVGVVDMPGGRIALSIAGQDMVAYVCNGTDSDPPTLARWMGGAVSAGAFDVGAAGVSVIGRLSGDRAAGTVILSDGSKRAFLAGSRSYGSAVAGLYRAEATFNGAQYVGGWIVNPNRHTASLPERSEVHLVSSRTPPARDIAGAAPITRAALEDEFDDYPRAGGAIINQAKGTLLAYVAPNFTTMTADVPGVGMLHLVACCLGGGGGTGRPFRTK
jgi:hypothetical protein